jgi:two-component system response regulator AlgR
MTLRVLLVDDEPLARARLRSLIDAIAEPAAAVGGEAADAAQALAWLGRDRADLLLLDIRMPGCSGLELAAALRALPAPPAVVFISAHAEHALAAFEIDAVDYLTKPVRRERLAAALQRVQQRLRPALAQPPTLVVQDRGRVLRLPLSELLFLKAEQKYVTLRTASRALVLDEALADLERRLGAGFLRVHRNAIVARHAVRALERRAGGDADEGWSVRIGPTGEWLAVSRRQLGAVREALTAAER